MKQKMVKWLVIAFLAVLVMQLSAGGKKVVRPLTIDDLKNATYKVLIDSKDTSSVKLIDGEFKQKEWPPEKPDYPYLVGLTDWIRFEDLNGDSIDDAAVVYYWSGGGSGWFYWLGAVINEEGKPVHVASTHLEDRVRVESLSIENGEMFLELVVHDVRDGACCPTLDVERRYKLKEGRLFESTRYTGSWQTQIMDSSGAKVEVRLDILPEGNVIVTREPLGGGRTIRKEGKWWHGEVYIEWPEGNGKITVFFPKISDNEGDDYITFVISKGKLLAYTYDEYIYGKNRLTLERVSQ